MSHTVTPKQALLLWKMITAETLEEREPKQGNTRPKLEAKERKPLIERGLLDIEKRGRASHLVLTDKAWAWAAVTMDVKVSNSAVGAEALQALLHRLLPFLHRHDLPLASLFTPDIGVASVANHVPDAKGASLAHTIEQACLTLTGGAKKQRVRLSALRKQLATVHRANLDEALLELQDAGRLVLYRDDNPASLTSEDHQAALFVGDAPRHIVYLEE